MPAPVLAECTEPLAPGIPDLRGLWKTVQVEVGGQVVPDHSANSHVERVEQAGLRLIVTSTGVVHDMICDGTEEHGVHDVGPDFTTPIHVVATFENNVHILRPVGVPVEVTRRLDGDQLIWSYAGLFVARMERIG